MLFKLALDKKGKLPATAVRVPITGDLVYATGNNANGIAETPIAEYDKRLYLPNARFTTPATPDTTYNAVGIKIP